VAILIAAAIAFAAWIAHDAFQFANNSETAETTNSREPGYWPPRMPADQLLMSLHVGMPRSIAQRHLAQLPPAPVDTEAISTGMQTLETAYRVTLHRPIPHLLPPHYLHAFQPGEYRLTVEYATDRPGAPITRLNLAPLPMD
jgi:hypothetical protein